MSSRAAKAVSRRADPSTALMEAAKKVLRKRGYAGLSTREVAEAAGVPLSQIHYHFGSKRGMVLALYEYLNDQLVDRQTTLFRNSALRLSEKWDLACDYLDEDIASGYVRVLQELTAASWSDPLIADVVRGGSRKWLELVTGLARQAQAEFGNVGPFSDEELGTLVCSAFIGAEVYFLLGAESERVPVRKALRRVGDVIRIAERSLKRG